MTRNKLVAKKPIVVFVIEFLVLFLIVFFLLNPILDTIQFLENTSTKNLVMGIPYIGALMYLLFALLGYLSGIRYSFITPLSINVFAIALFATVRYEKPCISVFSWEHSFIGFVALWVYIVVYTITSVCYPNRQKISALFSQLRSKLSKNEPLTNANEQNEGSLPALIPDVIKINQGSERGHYEKIAEAFSKVILNYLQQESENSFSVGIDGRWGSGKTYFLEPLLTQLDNKGHKVIRFNAWHSLEPNTLVKDFFDKWKSQFSNDLNLPGLIDNYVKSIVDREKDIFGTSYMTILQLVGDSSETNLLEEIKEKIRSQSNKRFCFVIDDVDRLDKEELHIILKLCRVMADFPNTIYFIAYDRTYVDSILQSPSTKENSKSFLDKIIQLEFKVPHIEDTQFLALVENILLKGGEKTVRSEEIKEIVRKNNDYIGYYLDNIRDIKRFSNTLFTRYYCVKENVDFETFFLVTLIEQREKDLFKTLATNENQYEWLSTLANIDLTNNFYVSLTSKYGFKLIPTTRHLLTKLIKDDSKPRGLRRNFEYYLLGDRMAKIRDIKNIIESNDDITISIGKAKEWLNDIKDMQEAIQFIGLAAFRFISTPSIDVSIQELDPTNPEHEKSRVSTHRLRRIVWLYFAVLKHFDQPDKANGIIKILLSIWDNSMSLLNEELLRPQAAEYIPLIPTSYKDPYVLVSDKQVICLGIDESIYDSNLNDVRRYNRVPGVNRTKPTFFKQDGKNYAGIGKKADVWSDIPRAYWIHPNIETKYLDAIQTTPFEYEYKFILWGNMDAKITILVDDKCTIIINGTSVDHTFEGFHNIGPNNECDITKFLLKGQNHIKFNVTNDHGNVTGLCFRIDFTPLNSEKTSHTGL